MANRKTITVKLEGAPEDDGDVQFGDFREFCKNLSACPADLKRCFCCFVTELWARSGKPLKRWLCLQLV